MDFISCVLFRVRGGYICCLQMARKFDLIKDIDDKKETLKLAVRVKDLWFVENRDTNRHMELILLDLKVNQVCCLLYFLVYGMMFTVYVIFPGRYDSCNCKKGRYRFVGREVG